MLTSWGSSIPHATTVSCLSGFHDSPAGFVAWSKDAQGAIRWQRAPPRSRRRPLAANQRAGAAGQEPGEDGRRPAARAEGTASTTVSDSARAGARHLGRAGAKQPSMCGPAAVSATAAVRIVRAPPGGRQRHREPLGPAASVGCLEHLAVFGRSAARHGQSGSSSSRARQSRSGTPPRSGPNRPPPGVR